MALDAGRAMCVPVNGVPRIDRAVSAALLTVTRPRAELHRPVA